MNEQFSKWGQKKYLIIKEDDIPKFSSLLHKVPDLLEFLQLNPDVGIQSKDNGKCKALFGQLGIIDFFRRSDEPNLSVLACLTNATHWIVGLLWSGYPKEEENGYQVFCLPKTRMLEEDIKAFMSYLIEQYDGHDDEERLVEMPTDWHKAN